MFHFFQDFPNIRFSRHERLSQFDRVKPERKSSRRLVQRDEVRPLAAPADHLHQQLQHQVHQCKLIENQRGGSRRL